MKTNVKVFTVIALGFSLVVGCSQGDVTKSLDAVVSATEAVLPLISGVTPEVAKEVTSYLSDASLAVNCVTQELASNDQGVIRAAKVAECFSSLNFSLLSPRAQQIASGVNTAIQTFLKLYPPTATVPAKTVNQAAVQKVAAHNVSARLKILTQQR